MPKQTGSTQGLRKARRNRLPRSVRAAQLRTTQALKHLRRGYSLSHAAKLAGTSPNTVIKYAGRRVERAATGKIVARRFDRRIRSMRFLAEQGQIAVDVIGSEAASRLSTYSNAARHFGKTGDWSQLKPFKGKYLQSHGVRYRYITDPATLERLLNAGEVRFEDLYNISR